MLFSVFPVGCTIVVTCTRLLAFVCFRVSFFFCASLFHLVDFLSRFTIIPPFTPLIVSMGYYRRSGGASVPCTNMGGMRETPRWGARSWRCQGGSLLALAVCSGLLLACAVVADGSVLNVHSVDDVGINESGGGTIHVKDPVTTSGSDVHVCWQGIPSAKHDDMIALYFQGEAAARANPKDLDHLGFVVSDVAPETYKKGEGCVSVRVVVTWSDAPPVFGYLSAAAGLVAVSEPLQFVDDAAILWPRLSVGDNEFDRVVTFTVSPNLNISLHDVAIHVRQVPTSEPNHDGSWSHEYAVAGGQTLTFDDMCTACSPHGWLEPGTQAWAILDHLPIDQELQYMIVGQQSGQQGIVKTAWTSFMVPSCSDGAARFIVFGDMGVSVAGQLYHTTCCEADPVLKLINDIAARKVDANGTALPPLTGVVNVGDLAYARGHAFQWNWYLQAITAHGNAAHVPWMVSVGNHEYDYKEQPFRPVWSAYEDDSGGECGLQYMANFRMPDTPASFLSHTVHANAVIERNLWYEYSQGPVHFIVLSTENDFMAGSEQQAFLVTALAAVDRDVTPWLAIVLHRPFVCTSLCKVKEMLTRDVLAAELDPIFVAAHVDVVLAGHEHTYARTCRMRVPGYTCVNDNEPGYVQLVTGMAGNRFFAKERFDVPVWQMYRSHDLGVVQMVATRTQLQFDYIKVEDGAVYDTVTLYK